MLNLGSGTILTNGLGGSAYNLLTFGPVNLYIQPLSDVEPPTPSPTPTPTPGAHIGRPGGVGYPYEEDEREDEKESLIYKITLTVKLTKRKTVTRDFIVDKTKKDFIVRRIGTINMIAMKFNTVLMGIKRTLKFKWKK